MSRKSLWILGACLGCSGAETAEPGAGSAPAAGALAEHGHQAPDPSGLPPPSAQPREQPPGEMELTGGCPADPRSILVVSWDTARADRLSIYGGRAEAPALAALAAGGARFDQAISHFPETAVSHWSLLTGVEPAVHGDVPAARGSRYAGPTLAEIAASCGYATGGFVGGVTLAAFATGLNRGFTHYDDHYDWQGGGLKRPASEITHRAAEWIEQQDGPWFAFVHYFDAHTPYQPPSPWDKAYDPDYSGPMDGSEAVLSPHWTMGDPAPDPRDLEHAIALYDGELSYLDTWLQRLVDAAGDDAVIALTSDHGESFENGYWFNHRESLWDSTLRVPLVIRAPGVPAGATVDAQVGLIDVMPTLLALSGLPADSKIQGDSLTPLFEGSGGGRPIVRATSDARVGRLAARTALAKAIWKDGDLEAGYDLGADRHEENDIGRVPGPVAGQDAAYAAWLETIGSLQRDLPEAAPHDPAEIERLRLLGYVDPSEETPGDGAGPPTDGEPAAPPRDSSPAPPPAPPLPDRSPPDRSHGPPGGSP